MEKVQNYKVLIVDDDEFLLNMYSVKFAKGGLTVQTSSSGDDALKRLREGFIPDAVVLDIVMPGTDGFELLEKIRSEKLAPNAVVIFLTNQGQSADIERAKSLDAAGYIVKASTIPSEVFNEVVKCIERESKKKQ